MIPVARGVELSPRHTGASVWPLDGFAFGLEIKADGCRLVDRSPTHAPVEVCGCHIGEVIEVNEAASSMLWIVDFSELEDYES